MNFRALHLEGNLLSTFSSLSYTDVLGSNSRFMLAEFISLWPVNSHRHCYGRTTDFIVIVDSRLWNFKFVVFKAFSVAFKKSYVFWDTISYSPMNGNHSYRETYRLILHDLRIIQVRKQNEAGANKRNTKLLGQLILRRKDGETIS
jgi:hypothetical protein